MSEKIRIFMPGLSEVVDLDGAYVVLEELIKNDSELRDLRISISNDVLKHRLLSYTTDVQTVGLIFDFKTLRSSSLTNAMLNDPMEKERVVLSQFAGSRFITCFSQIEHESVPFWICYGKKERSNKVLLQFRNFIGDFQNCIHTDYAIVDGKKCLFQSDRADEIINSRWVEPSVQKEYDFRGIVDSVQIFDVEYVPIDSSVFMEDNSGVADIDVSKFSQSGNTVVNMKIFDATVLGKQKSNPWDYEKESRIMCTLSPQEFSGWNYIDLRLKD